KVDTEYRLTLYFGRRVDPRERLSDNLVVLALLERGVGGNRERSRFADEVPVTQAPFRRRMNDAAILRGTGGARNSPGERRRRDQHFSRCGASFAHRIPGGADARAAASALIAVERAGSRLLNLDLFPIGFEFLGQNHWQSSAHTLA